MSAQIGAQTFHFFLHACKNGLITGKKIQIFGIAMLQIKCRQGGASREVKVGLERRSSECSKESVL